MILTSDEKLAKRVVILLNQGRIGRGWYVHDYIGYNFRMSDLQAGIGLAQLKKLAKIIKLKIRNEKLYRKYLAGVPGVGFLYQDPQGFRVPYRTLIYVDNPQGLMEFLNENNIKTARTFSPLHAQPCFNGKADGFGERINLRTKGTFPNTAYAYEKILNLPSGAGLSQSQIRYVTGKIKEFVTRQ
jgi:dTDP-4-amino-4,6-dideoxygalactose transaminase